MYIISVVVKQMGPQGDKGHAFTGARVESTLWFSEPRVSSVPRQFLHLDSGMSAQMQECSLWNVLCCVWGKWYLCISQHLSQNLSWPVTPCSLGHPGSKHMGETAWKIYMGFPNSQKSVSMQISEAEWTQRNPLHSSLWKSCWCFRLGSLAG